MEMTAPVRAFPYLLSRASGSFDRAWLGHLRDHGLTVARWQVLAILYRQDGCRVGAIADRASAEQAVVSRVVEQMERDGLVERRTALDDGRAVEVWLTRRGRATYDRLRPSSHDLLAEALDGESEQTVELLTELLMRTIARLDEVVARERVR